MGRLGCFIYEVDDTLARNVEGTRGSILEDMKRG